MSRVLLVTTFNTHYRDGLFRALQEHMAIDFLFFSDGQEPYWHGPTLPVGHLGGTTLAGFWIGRTRITPRLITEISRRDYDVVIKCANGKFALPVTFALAQVRRKPFILWTELWLEPRQASEGIAGPVRRWMERSSDAVIAFGRHVEERLRKQGVQGDRIFQTAQAVDNQRFFSGIERLSGVRNQALDRSTKTILFVGRLEAEKGVWTLFKAFSELADARHCRLVLAGEGSLRRQVLAEAEALSLSDRVSLLGYLDNSKLPPLYRQADVVVVPSEPSRGGAETWGLVANEAMGSGACVVASDAVGAVKHGLIADERTGLVFRSGDAEMLTRLLSRALSDVRLARRLGKAGRSEISKCTFQEMAAAFVDAVEFVTQAHDKPRSSAI